MTVTIQIPSDVEQAVRNRAVEAGVNIEAYVAAVIEDEVADDLPRHRLSHAEFQEKLRQIIERLPASGHFVDDSRESIYAGRGE